LLLSCGALLLSSVHDHGIDPGSELLFRSHKEKIEQMAAWDANPFVGMMLTREEGNAFRLGQP
jgi:hypothetical protein